MEQLVKGSHAPRVSAVCEGCGASFERSAVHPYIKTCQACRNPRAARAAAASAVISGAAIMPIKEAAASLMRAADLSDDEWLEALRGFRASVLVQTNSSRKGT